MSLLAELAGFVSDADIAALPREERAAAADHFCDGMAAILAGLRTSDAAVLRRLAGQATWPERTGLISAATRLTEIDDIHLPSCVTPTAVAMPVALSIAISQTSADPRELASAIWAGTELMTRLGEALSGPDILYRGIWPTYLVAPVGAAAVSCRLLRLDRTQATHALSLALMLASGGIGQFRGNPSGRWFIFAMAVAQGIRAALAAREGMVGDAALLDGAWFKTARGLDINAALLSDVRASRSVYSRLSLKPYCSSKQCIASIEALKDILGSGVAPDAISHITVRVPPPYAAMIRTKASPEARLSMLVSVAHQLAVTAYQPKTLYEVDRRPPSDPRLGVFADKVEVVAEPELQALYPMHWPAELEVIAGGQSHRRRVISAKGDPACPLSAAEIEHKAHAVLDGAMGRGEVSRWMAAARAGFDDKQGCGELLRLYAEETAAWEFK